MAFPEDIPPTEVCCEICGIRLEDEIVIQEFADGSLARLCPECAAGAVFDPVADQDEPEEAQVSPRPVAPPLEPALETEPAPETEPVLETEPVPRAEPVPEALEGPTPSVFPDITEADPLEMTRELLMPVTDLIELQTEMQVALERLAASLERFATGVLSDTMGRSTDADSRIKTLEAELERTRAHLRETESLLITTESPLSTGAQDATVTGAAAEDASPVDSVLPVVPLPTEEPSARPADPTSVAPPAVDASTRPADEEASPASADRPEQTPQSTEAATHTTLPWPDAPAPAASARAADDPSESAGEDVGTGPEGVFCLDEIRGTQRLFNESPFVERVKSVQRSLGKPKANLSRVAGAEPRVLVTIVWDIIWYQYLVDLRQDIPSSERVTCFREGMEMDELAAHFQEKNAIIDEDGRVDASEIEVRLLSDPTVLITEMPVDVEQALEDATEEIWDQRISPEFKWDD